MPFFELWGDYMAAMQNWANNSRPGYVPMGLRPQFISWDITQVDLTPGRRFRVLAAMLLRDGDNNVYVTDPAIKDPLNNRIKMGPVEQSFVEIYEAAKEDTVALAFLNAFPLRVTPNSSEDITYSAPVPARLRDAELIPPLQDLAYEINEDIVEACAALDDPNIFYPGVDEGIEPVTNEHVELVIWGLQRELNRELRPGKDNHVLPAVPLNELPWRIQRALAERRRLRYAQYGIGRQQWLDNKWSLWDVPEDPEFVPRRWIRFVHENKNSGGNVLT